MKSRLFYLTLGFLMGAELIALVVLFYLIYFADTGGFI